MDENFSKNSCWSIFYLLGELLVAPSGVVETDTDTRLTHCTYVFTRCDLSRLGANSLLRVRPPLITCDKPTFRPVLIRVRTCRRCKYIYCSRNFTEPFSRCNYRYHRHQISSPNIKPWFCQFKKFPKKEWQPRRCEVFGKFLCFRSIIKAREKNLFALV